MAEPEHSAAEPERDPLTIVLEELHDIMAILETLSRRVAAIEAILKGRPDA